MPDKRSGVDIKQRAYDVFVRDPVLLINPNNSRPESDVIIGLLERIRDLEEAMAVYDGIAEFYVHDGDRPEYFKELILNTPDTNTLLRAIEERRYGS